MFGSSRYSDNPITWSLSVGKLFGVRIRIHVLFLLIAAVLILRESANPSLGFVGATGIVAILFGIVLLHEFGHCFGARAVGGEAEEILLWPLGGLAYTRPPHTPTGHLVTTIAGPLVNVIICGACATFLILSDPAHGLDAVPWNPFRLGTSSFYTPPVPLWVSYVFSISYILLLFNLVPMYPLDGGRIVESLLWMRIGYRRASLVSCTTGMIGAIGLGLLGLIAEEFMLLGIAIFGYLTCWQQKQMVRAGEGFDESEFGYDFSQGYTSLERSYGRKAEAEPKRPSMLERWRAARAEQRRRREQEQIEADERMLDALLEKVHEHGLHSLTPAERRFLNRFSSKPR